MQLSVLAGRMLNSQVCSCNLQARACPPWLVGALDSAQASAEPETFQEMGSCELTSAGMLQGRESFCLWVALMSDGERTRVFDIYVPQIARV